MNSTLPGERDWLAGLFRSVGTIDGLGVCADIAITGPIHSSAQTRLYLGRLSTSPSNVLIKVAIDQRTGLADIDFARDQFKVLAQASQARVNGLPLAVPRPFHLFENEAVIVQSWVEGRGLDDVLSEFGASHKLVDEYMRAAGEWLGRFHSACAFDEKYFSTSHMVDEVRAGANSGGASGKLLGDVARWLHACELILAKKPQKISRIHCDFKPSNLIVSGSGLVGIDFHNSNLAPVCFDLAHFLNAAALDWLKAGRFDLIARMQSIERAFLAGYRANAHAVEEPAIRFFLTYDLARYVLQYRAMRPEGIREIAKAWVIEQLLAHRLRSLTKALAAASGGTPSKRGTQHSACL
jgi:aminoglycoside phosphotransferase (APT) family kinase protein